MENSEYVKVFSGSFIIVQRIAEELNNTGIVPIIKDETESGRLAGFASSISGFQELLVNNEESEKAMEIVNRVKAEMEAY